MFFKEYKHCLPVDRVGLIQEITARQGLLQGTHIQCFESYGYSKVIFEGFFFCCIAVSKLEDTCD